MTIQHRDADPDDNGGQGSHGIRSWSDVTDEAARAALGASVPIGITVYQSAGVRPGYYASVGGGDWSYVSEPLETVVAGWRSGLLVTQNVANPTTRVDVAAGTMRVAGALQQIDVGPFLDVTLDNLATEEFTILLVSSAGTLVQVSGRTSTPEERRTHAVLQTINHPIGAITAVDSSHHDSTGLMQASADYAYASGPVNTGNNYSAASNDLTIKKSEGITDGYMLSSITNPDNPNGQSNPAENPVGALFQVIRDGSGGHTLSLASGIPVGFWDNDNGVLDPTPKFVNFRFYFFNGSSGFTVGQQTYDTLGEAETAALLEDPDIPQEIAAIPNTLRTILSVKGDVTDLSSNVDMRFLQTSPSVPGGVITTSSL